MDDIKQVSSDTDYMAVGFDEIVKIVNDSHVTDYSITTIFNGYDCNNKIIKSFVGCPVTVLYK